jgi:hypothetical protein
MEKQEEIVLIMANAVFHIDIMDIVYVVKIINIFAINIVIYFKKK